MAAAAAQLETTAVPPELVAREARWPGSNRRGSQAPHTAAQAHGSRGRPLRRRRPPTDSELYVPRTRPPARLGEVAAAPLGVALLQRSSCRRESPTDPPFCRVRSPTFCRSWASRRRCPSAWPCCSAPSRPCPCPRAACRRCLRYTPPPFLRLLAAAGAWSVCAASLLSRQPLLLPDQRGRHGGSPTQRCQLTRTALLQLLVCPAPTTPTFGCFCATQPRLPAAPQRGLNRA